MNDNEKKNVIFHSDKNTPCVKEFALLNDSEIAELVDRRLYSNNYCDYTIYSIDKSNGSIMLIRDACGHKVKTTLSQIEDGLISEKCADCRQAEKEKLLAFKNEIQDELKERGLIVELFETEENTDSIYIECTKCGAKYYLNEDFEFNNEAWEMYCKNWDCMMDALALENHWLAKSIQSGEIVIKEISYKSDYSPFIKDFEDWVDNLDEFDGSHELKCKKCNAINLLPLGKWECEACTYFEEDNYSIEKWDELSDEAIIRCKKCGSQYGISCDDLREEVVLCFICYKQCLEKKHICPVCDTEYDEVPYFCHTCNFPMNESRNNTIRTQAQYTNWIKNTVNPCISIWREINPKYVKALNDFGESLENETKLLKENQELNKKLSQCYTEITEDNKKISALYEEIKYKNAKISEMKTKTSVLSMLNQTKETAVKSNFRNLINKFAIVLNDDVTMACLKNELPEGIEANSVLVYGYYDGMAGMSFMVLGLTYYEDGEYTLVWTNKEIGITVRGERYEKAKIIPIDNKTLFRCFDNMISMRDSSSFWRESDIGKTRKFETLDEFRHFSFPDDILVTFINHDIQKAEKIWARLRKYIGRDNGNDVFVATLLDEPFDERFGIHSGEDVFAVVRQDNDGSYTLFGLKMGL